MVAQATPRSCASVAIMSGVTPTLLTAAKAAGCRAAMSSRIETYIKKQETVIHSFIPSSRYLFNKHAANKTIR